MPSKFWIAWSFIEAPPPQARQKRLTLGGAARSISARRRRGAAFIEAILMMGVFSIVWAGVVFMGHLHGTTMDTRTEARGCAWRIATRGCESVPPDCAQSATAPSGVGEEKLQKLGGTAPRSGSSTDDKVAEATDSAIGGVMFRRVSSSAYGTARRPPLLGNDVDVTSKFGLPCNTRPGGVDDLVEDLASDFLGGN